MGPGNEFSMREIGPSFFMRSPLECARELIGAHFHWAGCTGKIVETEAYLSENDPACHTWFRPSARHFVASHEAGAAYVYLNYGVHWLFNVLAKGEDASGFVLFRAVEPVDGLDAMRSRRPLVTDHLLGAGPGKLTRAMGIDGSAHGMDFLEIPGHGLSLGEPADVCCGVRIGITKAVELPWRFGDRNSRSLSRKF